MKYGTTLTMGSCPMRVVQIGPFEHGEEVKFLRDQYYHLRKRIWVEQHGWEEKSDRDAADEYSSLILLVCRVDGFTQVLGGCRLIHGSYGPLPVSLAAEVPSTAVELSRWCIDAAALPRAFVRSAMRQLVLETLLEGERLQLSCVYADIRTGLANLLEQEGVVMTKLGLPHKKGEHQFIPVQIHAVPTRSNIFTQEANQATA